MNYYFELVVLSREELLLGVQYFCEEKKELDHPLHTIRIGLLLVTITLCLSKKEKRN